MSADKHIFEPLVICVGCDKRVLAMVDEFGPHPKAHMNGGKKPCTCQTAMFIEVADIERYEKMVKTSAN